MDFFSYFLGLQKGGSGGGATPIDDPTIEEIQSAQETYFWFPEESLYFQEVVMGSYSGTVDMTVREQKKVRQSFAGKMITDEVITAAVFSATRLSDGADATSDVLITGSTGWTNTTSYYGVKGGTAGEEYSIRTLVTTNRTLGNSTSVKLEATHLLRVSS